MKNSVTIRDIADETGLSFQTVSRILGGKAALHKKETVLRVEEVAERLGYVRNLFAKGMQGGKSYSVGMIIDPFVDSFTEGLFRGCHDSLLDAGYLPILLMHSGKRDDSDLIRRLAERRVEGIVIRPQPNLGPAFAESLKALKIPVVSVDYTIEGASFDFVGTADEAGGVEAAKYLMGLGHKKIAGIFSDVETLTLRKHGFISALANEGIEADVLTIKYDELADACEGAIRKILQKEDAPTALFSGGDWLLPYIWRAANDCNVRIPEDISVVGFGGADVSEKMIPAVTTFQQDAYQIGVQAVDMVMQRINKKVAAASVCQVRMQASLVERDSTAPFAV